MAYAIYNITFTPVAGSYGTLIEYRETTDGSEWITPTNPGNPTLTNPYPIALEEGKSYFIGLTSIGLTCAQSRKIVGPIEVPVTDVCCPPTYTLSIDGTYCYKYDEVSATVPTDGENTVAHPAVQYSTCGSYIYAPGYASDGTGASTQISLSNAFWKNGGTCVDNNTVDGPLNRCGLWSPTTLSNQDVGFSVCITAPSNKTYYIGIACDNYAIVNLDGDNIITQDAAALDTQYSVGGACFKVWHIYPLQLTAGPHVIELIGHNDASIAGMGAEIYNNTSAQIAAATSYSGLNLLFSTKDYIGQPVQIGTDGIGYECPSGYSLVACQDPYICRRILTTSTTTC